MQYLKADTAATILIGPFVAPADGVTPVTNITLAAADHAELMKHDGTTFVDLTSDSRTFTHKEGGFYTLALATGDMDTEGRLTVVIMDTSACLPVWKDFMVVNANVFDSLFAAAAADYLQVDTIQVTGTSQTANDNGADINAILIDTDEIGTAGAGLSDLGGMSSGMKTEVESECNDALVAQKLDHLVAVADGDDPVNNSIIAHLVSKDATADWSDYDNETESLEALHDGPLADIESDTQDLQSQVGTAGAGLSDLGGMSTTMKGQVESEVTDSLIVHNLDHLMKTAVANRDVIAEVVDGTVLANLMTKTDGDTSDFDPDTDSLEALRDRGDAEWVTGGGGSAASVADAVWDEAHADHETAASTGASLKQARGRKLLD